MPYRLKRFAPYRARIGSVVPESDDTRTFVLKFEPPTPAFDGAAPGQFVMLSVWGIGEAAFTLSALPALGGEAGCVTVTVRRVGRLTGALFDLAPGAFVGLRGPFGRGFPVDDPARPTVYVAGGCGLSPMKAAIDWHVTRRPPGTPLAIAYGARHVETRIHKAALARWARAADVTVIECVERAGIDWPGRRGVVGDFVQEAVDAVGATRAALCGPPAMLLPAAEALRGAGVADGEIFLAVERHMKCGTGHCGHCYVGHRYVCTDGPVFSLRELLESPDAFPELRAGSAPAPC